MPTLILGRDGMGDDATEADFANWVQYVCDHIDEACGFEVNVETRGERDVQDDAIVRASLDQESEIDAVKQDLWNDWCAAGAPGEEKR